MSFPPEKCYLDTSFLLVIGYYMTIEERRLKIANKFIDDLDEKNITKVISYWVLVEALCVIWEDILKSNLDSNKRGKLLENHVNDKLIEYWKQLLTIIKGENIKIVLHKESDLKNIYLQIKNGFTSKTGESIWVWKLINGTRKKIPKYAGAPDLFHLEIATKNNIEYFVTFDKGFSNIAELKNIYSGKIEVLT